MFYLVVSHSGKPEVFNERVCTDRIERMQAISCLKIEHLTGNILMSLWTVEYCVHLFNHVSVVGIELFGNALFLLWGGCSFHLRLSLRNPVFPAVGYGQFLVVRGKFCDKVLWIKMNCNGIIVNDIVQIVTQERAEVTVQGVRLLQFRPERVVGILSGIVGKVEAFGSEACLPKVACLLHEGVAFSV